MDACRQKLRWCLRRLLLPILVIGLGADCVDTTPPWQKARGYDGSFSDSGAVATGGAVSPPGDGAQARPPEAGAGATTSTEACGASGVRDTSVCWYLGLGGASCAATCAPHGGTSDRAASHIGTPAQGGSSSECARLLGRLGVAGRLQEAIRPDGLGLGCHIFPRLGNYWLTSPDYSDTASLALVRLVCGCLQ